MVDVHVLYEKLFYFSEASVAHHSHIVKETKGLHVKEFGGGIRKMTMQLGGGISGITMQPGGEG